MKWNRYRSLVAFLGCLSAGVLHADPATSLADGAVSTPATPATSPSAAAAPADETLTPAQKKPKATRGKGRAREKETDGTEALHRFETDTVIKSQYKLDGQSLEVDPD